MQRGAGHEQIPPFGRNDKIHGILSDAHKKKGGERPPFSNGALESCTKY